MVGRAFPYGTLVVNFVGSFLMGLLFAILFERVGSLSEQLRVSLLVGIFYWYFLLMEQDEWMCASLNITYHSHKFFLPDTFKYIFSIDIMAQFL